MIIDLGSNQIVVTLPTETLDELIVRAALAGMNPAEFLSRVIEGVDVGDWWDEALDAIMPDDWREDQAGSPSLPTAAGAP